jgi:hypothetical protein
VNGKKVTGSELDKFREPAEFSPILCSVPRAAAMIGRGTRFIYEAIATGQIQAVKSNKRTLVVVASLREYAAKLPAAKIRPMTRHNAVVRPDGQPREIAVTTKVRGKRSPSNERAPKSRVTIGARRKLEQSAR